MSAEKEEERKVENKERKTRKRKEEEEEEVDESCTSVAPSTYNTWGSMDTEKGCGCGGGGGTVDGKLLR